MKQKTVCIITAIFLVLLITYIYTYLRYERYELPSSSMLPTIQVGDIVTGDKFAEPQRFNIVSARFKSQNEAFLFRLIGLPGDNITYINNELCINLKCLEKQSLYKNKNNTIFSEGEQSGYRIQLINQEINISDQPNNIWKWSLKADEYILLGDNRDVANDSRYLGVINKSDIISVVDLTK